MSFELPLPLMSRSTTSTVPLSQLCPGHGIDDMRDCDKDVPYRALDCTASVLHVLSMCLACRPPADSGAAEGM